MTLAEKLRDLCLEGLSTDGAHHKQWYLEQMLVILVTEKTAKALKDEIGWEPGIPA